MVTTHPYISYKLFAKIMFVNVSPVNQIDDYRFYKKNSVIQSYEYSVTKG